MIKIPIPDDFEIRCDWFKYIPFHPFIAKIIGYLLVKNWIAITILSPEQMGDLYYSSINVSETEKIRDQRLGFKILGMWIRKTRTICLSSKNETRAEFWTTYIHELAHTRKISILEFDKLQAHGPDWASVYIALNAKSAGLFWFLGGGMEVSMTTKSKKPKK